MTVLFDLCSEESRRDGKGSSMLRCFGLASGEHSRSRLQLLLPARAFFPRAIFAVRAWPLERTRPKDLRWALSRTFRCWPWDSRTGPHRAVAMYNHAWGQLQLVELEELESLLQVMITRRHHQSQRPQGGPGCGRPKRTAPTRPS
jgi:hypothetical protein